MIHSSHTDRVVTIELARETKRNALDEEMVAGLAAAFAAAVDGGARAIVLTGRGPVFCAGADLSGPVYDKDFLDRLVATLQQIESTPVPVIAAPNPARSRKPTSEGWAGIWPAPCWSDPVVLTGLFHGHCPHLCRARCRYPGGGPHLRRLRLDRTDIPIDHSSANKHIRHGRARPGHPSPPPSAGQLRTSRHQARPDTQGGDGFPAQGRE